MPQTLLQLFKKQWTAKQYVLQGDTVLLAVSGGRDSMVMAHIFLQAGIPFAVAHCNFGLRGEESDLDELLVNDWCIINKIAFHSVRFPTKQKALDWKKGTQETARILRYEWFEQIRKAHHYAKIVTAHHANDNVETLLINLFKGTGIGGMHGILPDSGHIVRPLLFAPREMLAEYGADNGIAYREDASNASDDYLRNAVRHNIVPAIEQSFPNAVINVNESIERFAEVEILYKAAIAQERKKLLEQRGQDYYISVLKLQKHQPLATICYELLLPFGFASAQVPHVLKLLSAGTGHYVSSATHRIIRNRNFLIITTLPAQTADLILVEAAPCTIETGKYRYSFSIAHKPATVPADSNIAYLDMKSVEFPLILRKWRMGDYCYPFGMKMKKKKVSRMLIDGKVALHDKEEVRVLESSKRIAWVCGIRPDERFKIKDSTEQVLVVKQEKSSSASC